MKIISVVGARPNFMKIAAIAKAITAHNKTSAAAIDHILVHTGQHYDEKMSRLFFEELGIPRPDVDLGVGSGSHAEQTAEIMKRFEKVCLDVSPTHVLVVGDVNSTIACALVASKLNIRIIHVEAGLRSFDRTMPEEINRVLTDAISDCLFVTEESALENLSREGVSPEKIFFVGNVMIDTLLFHRDKALRSPILDTLGLCEKEYYVLTLHRPSNVDNRETFAGIIRAVSKAAEKATVIFPVHPRTRKKIEEFGLSESIKTAVGTTAGNGIHALDPLGYLDFLALTSRASLVITDSGGIQEETTVLGVPCVTLRNNTERPATATHGTNVLAGTEEKGIQAGIEAAFAKKSKGTAVPPLWDGSSAQRIVEILASIADDEITITCKKGGAPCM